MRPATNCPSCGRPTRAGRQTTPSIAAVDTSRLSDIELYRHYHRTAPIDDLWFFLRCRSLAADVRADGETLLAAGCRDTGGRLSRAEWYRRLTALQDRWRRDSADAPVIEASAPLAEAV